MIDPRMAEMARYARIPLELNAREGDRVLILTDRDTDASIPQAFLIAARQLGFDPTVVIAPPRRFPYDNPTQQAAAAMGASDLIVAVTSQSILHSAIVLDQMMEGRRLIMAEELKPEYLISGGCAADYAQIARDAEPLNRAMTEGRRMRVATPAGTDLAFSIEGRAAISNTGVATARPGLAILAGGFPDGVVHMSPVEGTSNGRLVADVSIHGIGTLTEPVSFEVRQGWADGNPRGGRQAEEVRALIERYGDEGSWNCPAQVGLGINPAALVRDNIKEHKKKLGHVVVALGGNLDIGGTVRSATHLDCIMSGATVWIDNRLVMENGRLLPLEASAG
ncbi:MAG: hypothetical protein IT307_16845 [Chloroflexi bacterium]|nr:hypothetical protein [Chloroflexota bacterium]